MNSAASASLERALELSRELASIADSGDVQLTQRLDAERLQLLKSAKSARQPLGDEDRRVLREIAALNDKAIGFLEHRRRCKARDLDMVSAGRRAVRAYGSAGRYRY
jgi:hypothetical protein